MKTSTPDIPKPRQPTSILLMGPPGSRKTTLSMQFPDVCFIDCDMNLDGPERANRMSNPKLSYSYEVVSVKDDGTLVDPSECYARTVAILAQLKSSSFKWVCLDGLTAINEYIIRKIMSEQRISYMEARNWSTFKSDAINLLFTKLRHLGKNVIVTAHEESITRADPKNIMQATLVALEPFLQSKAQEQLGGFFTDMWRIIASPGVAGKVDVTLFCDKQPLISQLKNSLGLPGEIKDPSYEKLHTLSKGLI